jgi:tRNA(fMet)-specific endonuclease VapC
VRFLLDTNIVIYVRRERPDSVLRRFRKLAPGEACISVITYGELRVGAEKSVQRVAALSKLEELRHILRILAIEPNIGEAYGAIRAALEARGELISSNDLWIAAQAVTLGLTLVTNNEREFSRVPGLTVENWAR